MLAHGVSKYDPDPLAAVEGAKEGKATRAEVSSLAMTGLVRTVSAISLARGVFHCRHRAARSTILKMQKTRRDERGRISDAGLSARSRNSGL
jgi:hypothetical protein